jgi:hypothetical protein
MTRLAVHGNMVLKETKIGFMYRRIPSCAIRNDMVAFIKLEEGIHYESS